jgi:hypothetical protein
VADLYEVIPTLQMRKIKPVIKRATKKDLSHVDDGSSPLSWACRYRHPPTVMALIEAGADVNAGNPLATAAESDEMLEIVEVLIDRGASLEGVDRMFKCTPLAIAVSHGALRNARLLLSRGASLDVKGPYGDELLDLADGRMAALLRSAAKGKVRAPGKLAPPKPAPAPKLPAEYRRFVDERRYEQYNLMRCTKLGGGRDTQFLRFFVDGKLVGLKREHVESELLGDLIDAVGEKRAKDIRLFAAFDGDGKGSIDSGALVIDLGKSAGGRCPVFAYSDAALRRVAASIADFVATLKP